MGQPMLPALPRASTTRRSQSR